MDYILFNEHVDLASPDADTWKEYFEKNPAVQQKFTDGIASPVFIDLLMPNKTFKPTHKDAPEKNGKQYRITEAAIIKAVENGQFDGLPVYLHDMKKGDHGYGRRKTVGITHAAKMCEDKRGVYAQVLASVWESEIPEEFKEIKGAQDKIGASAEFSVKHSFENGDITEIDEFLPTGTLILEKNLAAFKETALYCSEPLMAGEAGKGQTNIDSDNCDNKPKTKKGGKAMDICENCQPLVDAKVSAAVEAANEKLQKDLEGETVIQAEKEELQLAATEAKTKTDEAVKALKDYEDKREKDEKNLIALSEAIEGADKVFEARRGDYPEDKHGDVKKLLLKMELGDATPTEVLALADWKESPKQDDKGEDDDQLALAGGAPDNKGDNKPKKYTKAEIDEMAGLVGLSGYVAPEKGGN